MNTNRCRDEAAKSFDMPPEELARFQRQIESDIAKTLQEMQARVTATEPCDHILKFDPHTEGVVCEMADCDLSVTGEQLMPVGFLHNNKWAAFACWSDGMQRLEDERDELLAENARLRRRLERKR